MKNAKLLKRLSCTGLLYLLPIAAFAHVGNPDIYFDGNAGPYRLLITIRPPQVIPGVAQVEVRTPNSGVRSLQVVPVPLDAQEVKFAPVADTLKGSSEDPRFFTGSLWIMAAGSWQVRLTADGAAGRATLGVPVPSVALTTKKMQPGLGAGLTLLMLLLVAGLILMAGAAVREAQLEPGVTPGRDQEKRARRAMAAAFLGVTAVLALGWRWWSASEAQYRHNIFTPLRMQANLDRTGLLRLNLSDNSALPTSREARLQPALFRRTTDDLVLDHDHLMHLYAIREPNLDVVYHLHPQRAGAGEFELQMPEMDPGRYRLYADIVHANGFPETPVADIDVPAGLPGRPLSGDDARGSAPPWQKPNADSNAFHLADGYTMIWNHPPAPLHAKVLHEFRFTLLDAQQRVPDDMRLYMGMIGHAAFVKTDGSAFAHIHPSGSVSMASLMMAQHQLRATASANGDEDKKNEMDMSNMDMSGMNMQSGSAVPNEVTFPYGFPSPGRYRIIVQMKHGETVETGIFDATVQ